MKVRPPKSQGGKPVDVGDRPDILEKLQFAADRNQARLDREQAIINKIEALRALGFEFDSLERASAFFQNLSNSLVSATLSQAARDAIAILEG